MSLVFRDCADRKHVLTNQMRGAPAFLCVNGPSSMAEIDKSLLYKPGITRMCVNNGAKAVRPNLWTCVDPPDRFLKSVYFDPTITKFVPRGFCSKALWDTEHDSPLHKQLMDAPNVFQYEREVGFDPKKFLTLDKICWGLGKGQTYKSTTGVRSVMLVATRILCELGFSKIFIVGCDFHMREDQPYSFAESKHSGGCRANNKAYEGLNLIFSELRPELEKAGIHVYNTYSKSGLRAFDYVPFEDAIALALKPIGDPETEITEGMYGVRKRMAKKIEELRDTRKLSGEFSPSRALPVATVSDLLISKTERAKTVATMKPKPRRPKKGKPYTVLQCWNDREKVIELFPDLQTFATRIEKRIADVEATKRKGKRCRGCEIARFSRRFYQEFVQLIPSNLETIRAASFLAPYNCVTTDNTIKTFEEL